jgi:hypothetical protein
VMATRRTTPMHSNYINMINHIICLFNINSCHAAEATQQHINPYNVYDFHGLVVLQCGEDGLTQCLQAALQSPLLGYESTQSPIFVGVQFFSMVKKILQADHC